MGNELSRMVVAQPLHHAEAKANGEIRSAAGDLKGAVPSAGVDADRLDLDAVVARIPHDLRRRIEPHRLAVQQRGAENVRVVALHPGRRVGDQREARGVALREAVGAEPLELRKGPLGEGPLVALVDHPLDQLVLEVRDAAGDGVDAPSTASVCQDWGLRAFIRRRRP